MSAAEIEARLRVEEDYLAIAVQLGQPVVIALAQANVAEWSRRLREARLAEEGGWVP